MPQGLNFLPIILVFVVFYFFLILPEKKKQKQLNEMLNAVRVGDVVLTRGGIKGKVVSVEGDNIVLQTGPDDVKISMLKMAIGQVLEKAADVKYNDINEESKVQEIAAEEIEEKNE
ncbi:preprotein translocase subunit YajC [Fervidicella metallireducens AeB]|uniref:Preprotein translocase subunit YajC n=1 Tax=Fervidicella metallireducens AeB TaxID=1403537 RepID=A0A017RXZ0_9CLOT|nr:preprotein translocase subunit YajC [Fervidicella metallireducens]EYE89623.1 preprotein translocase subunit YajC [Fervidicella metallireducens AeB]